MKQGNWNNINSYLIEKVNIIFKDYNISELSDYEKRKIIFEYLCSNISYDYDLLEKIKNFNLYKKPVVRELYLELENVIYNNKGICNAISQYYKLLLEKVGVKALCVVCDDSTDVFHQLNVVYDKENDSYSFDDVTSVIVNRGTVEKFFDYDIEMASTYNQGNRKVYDDNYWVVMPDNNLNFLVGRKLTDEDDNFNLPSNIVSVKSSKINNSK